MATYREIFVDDVYDFKDLFLMHEFLDRKDYDQALEMYRQDKEAKKK